MWSIYKITNTLNNKIYIGQTSQKIQDRWNDHKKCKDDYPLQRAIKKYGWDNFTKEVIETVDSFEQAIEREKYWINYYKTCIPIHGNQYGYNLTPGGEGVIRITPEQEELILQLWNQHKNLTQIGKILHIDRHTAQRILARKGVSSEEFQKNKFYHYHPIYVYNLNGELLNVYDTRNEVCQKYNINTTQIDNVLTHKMASTHKLIFLYEEDKLKLNDHILRAHKTLNNKIKSTNIKTKEIIIYDSIGQAQNETGIDRHTIRNRIRKGIIKDNIRWEDLN